MRKALGAIVVVASMVITSFLPAGAETAPMPPPVRNVCINSKDQVFQANALSDCAGGDTALAIPQFRPLFVCADLKFGTLTRAASANGCNPSKQQELTIPDVGPVFVCAADRQNGVIEPTGLLRRVDDPGQCDLRKETPFITPSAPIAKDDSYTTNEDTVLTVPAAGVLANDDELDGNPLTARLQPADQSGVTFNPDGSFTVDPRTRFNGLAAGQTATLTFTYVANDGVLDSSVATVTVHVTGVDDQPVGNADTFSVPEGDLLSVPAPGVLANDSDAEHETLRATLVSGPTAAGFASAGNVTLNADGSFSYRQQGAFSSLADGQQATVRFTYQVGDPTATGNTVSVTVLVNGSNNPPTAVDDSYSTDSITPLHIPAAGVLGNDSDAEGQAITAQAVAGTSTPPGVFTLGADGALGFDPRVAFASLATGQQATATLEYRAVDTQDGVSAPATITVHVAGLSAPTAVDDARTTDENTAIDINPLNNDTSQGGAISSIDTSGTRGTVTGPDAAGVLHYDPAGAFDSLQVGENATDTFRYTVTNGKGSSTATVTITVTGVNDAPVGVRHSYSASESMPLIVPAPGVLGGATDAENDPLTARLVAPPAKGRLTLRADGSFEYDSDGELSAGQSDSVTFQYLVSDGRAESAPQTVTVTVSGANNAPVVTPGQSASVQETSPVGTAVLTVDYTDPDPGQSHSFAIVGGDPGGQFAIDASGQITVAKPGLDAATTPSYTLTVQVSDDAGGSGTGTVTITVTDVNTPPVPGPARYATTGNTELAAGGAAPVAEAAVSDPANVLAGATDDGPSSGLSVVAASGATSAGGSYTIAADGSFRYEPPRGVTGSTDTFDYQLSDGANIVTGTVSIDVRGMVWYVDGAASTGGDGTALHPYTDTATFNGTSARPDSAGDTVFLFGGGVYSAPVVLKNDERLLGQGADLVMNGAVLVPHGSAPTIVFAGAAGGITLAQGDEVAGLNVAGNDGSAISGSQVGSLTLGVGTIDVARGAALDLNAGTVSGSVGPITATDTPADVVRLNQLGGTLSLTSSSGGTAVAAQNTGRSAVHVNAPTSLVLSGAVLDLGGTAGNGLEVTANAGSLTVPGGAVRNAGGTGILVEGGTGTFSTAAAVSGGTGHAVQISDLAAPSSVTLSGPISDHGTGIALAENAPGSSVVLSGALDLSTGSHDAFSASFTGSTGEPQGGVVSVTGKTNIATTTTGVAVKDVNVPIGAAGLTFQSVSASGAANGILLRNTGFDGALRVTGGTTAYSGGVIADAATGVLIDGGRASLTHLRISRSTRNGVDLENAKNVTLSGVTVEDSAHNGILGNTVTDLVVNNQSLIQRSNDSNVSLNNLLGNSSVTATSLNGSFGGPQIDVHNSTASSTGPDVLQLTGVSFSQTPGVGVQAVADTGSNLRVLVGSAAPSPLISLADGTTGVSGQAVNGGRLDVQVTKLLRSFGTGDAVALDASGAGSTLTYKVYDNTSANGGGFRNPGASGVRLTAEQNATLSGAVTGNDIVEPSADGVVESATFGGHISADVESNQVSLAGCLVGTTSWCGNTPDATSCPQLVTPPPTTIPPTPWPAPVTASGVRVSVGDSSAPGDTGGQVDGTIASNGITDPLTSGVTVDVQAGHTGSLAVSGNRVIETYNCTLGANSDYGTPTSPHLGVPVPSPIRLTNRGGSLTVTGGVNTVQLTKSPDNAMSVESNAGSTSISLDGDRTTNGGSGIVATAAGGSSLDFAEADAVITGAAHDGIAVSASDSGTQLTYAVSGTTITAPGSDGVRVVSSGDVAASGSVTGDSITDPGGDAVDVEGGDSATITGNTISGAADRAVSVGSMRGDAHLTVADNSDSTGGGTGGIELSATGATSMCLTLTGNASDEGYFLDDASLVPYYLVGYSPDTESIAQWASGNGNSGPVSVSGNNFRGPTCS